ncbi:hypothetical protein C8J57DRAFT_1722113 [Mycena rebaudengoi]|nr:hypothetical protein C8J57DRAFT_1722113 [Mycena rebaudengoi]
MSISLAVKATAAARADALQAQNDNRTLLATIATLQKCSDGFEGELKETKEASAANRQRCSNLEKQGHAKVLEMLRLKTKYEVSARDCEALRARVAEMEAEEVSERVIIKKERELLHKERAEFEAERKVTREANTRSQWTISTNVKRTIQALQAADIDNDALLNANNPTAQMKAAPDSPAKDPSSSRKRQKVILSSWGDSHSP